MIRYVHIGDQITDGDDAFAFYDTVTDSFLLIAGEQVWMSIADLEEALRASEEDSELDRLLSLIPPGRHGKDDGRKPLPGECPRCARSFNPTPLYWSCVSDGWYCVFCGCRIAGPNTYREGSNARVAP